MNVVVIAPYALLAPSFEVDLEIVQNHLDAGDQVTVLACNGELPACYPNPRHERTTCDYCMGRRIQGLKFLSGRVAVHPVVQMTPEVAAEIATLPAEFADHEELKNFCIGSFDAGYAVLSTIVSITRDPEVNLREQAPLVRNLLAASVAVYRSLAHRLAEKGVDRVYVLNGRTAPSRAVLRACQAAGVDCYTHEDGHDRHHYALHKNTLLHDKEYMKAQIKESWERGDPHTRAAIGAEWFEQRTRPNKDQRYQFVEQQSPQTLPANWDPTRCNIVVFPSSEDEFAAISDSWRSPIYEDQLTGMKAILAAFRDEPGRVHFHVRMHPWLTNVNNEQIKDWNSLGSSFVSVIPSESPVSTYTLMQRADKVFTFGSTTGIEAVYWGRPSVLAGSASYEDLGGTYRATTHEEVVDLLRRDLAPQDVEPALIFGYHLATFGVPLKHYKSLSMFDGEFKGHRIRPSYLVRKKIWLADRLARWFSRAS